MLPLQVMSRPSLEGFQQRQHDCLMKRHKDFHIQYKAEMIATTNQESDRKISCTFKSFC